MKPVKWITIWAVITFGLLGIIACMVYRIDPFFHYHSPLTDRYYYVLDNQRSQNDGIVRHFDYDALITGTSLVDNFRTSEAEALFGGSFIKVPSDGGSYKEINDLVARAAEVNPDLHTVIRGLDMAGFWTPKDGMREDLGSYPTYLYDSDPFNDVKYLFNKDIFPGRICRMFTAAIAKGTKPGITSFDEYSSWEAENGYGMQAVCPNGISTERTGEDQPLTEEERKQEAEAFAKAAICVSRQPHRRPRPMTQEAADEKEAGNTEIAQPDRPEEPQDEDHSGTQGAGQPAEPFEERPRPESENTVAVSLDEEGDDDDDDFADDADWQSFQQSQKQVG